ncbi:hypothetical protein H0G86_001678 [Trichoderma simmonsii]|uniref:Uncharacterized protein n=1 Tax=Trichoderma simmonsii TaxID=1491479 RepID=A0A8G0L223_9HYPO|nr:hypothetical protein H0G86_001678 [Trichoderma simmonsii]
MYRYIHQAWDPHQDRPPQRFSRTLCTMIRSFKGIKQATDDFDRMLYPNQDQPLCKAIKIFRKEQFFSSVKYALVAFHTARPDVDAPPGHASLTNAENPQEISETQNHPLYVYSSACIAGPASPYRLRSTFCREMPNLP